MTMIQQIITIAICVFGTILLRFLPFLIFKPNQPTPKYIVYLGKSLPLAIFAMLVVYSIRSASFFSNDYAIKEWIAILFVVLIHLYKRNMFISIVCGTIFYMLLIRLF